MSCSPTNYDSVNKFSQKFFHLIDLPMIIPVHKQSSYKLKQDCYPTDYETIDLEAMIFQPDTSF